MSSNIYIIKTNGEVVITSNCAINLRTMELAVAVPVHDDTNAFIPLDQIAAIQGYEPVKKVYNPEIHYNHCAMCGSPILTEEERNAHCDEDGNPYHYGCAREMGDLHLLDEGDLL